ncbi:MAG: CAP domain-containing protein, partial [Solirubrobacteraceae bacterium]
RLDRGLPEIGARPELELAAQRHARDMVRRRYFSHVTPGGRTMTARLRTAGYVGDTVSWAAGEVLAWGSGKRSTPAAAVAAWMDSPAHRRVLLDRRYRDVGIGVALGTPVGSFRRPAATYAAELGFVSPE